MIQRSLILLVVPALVWAMGTGVASAKKGGNKPPGGSSVTGTIYFVQGGAPSAMDAATGNTTILPSGVGGFPSHADHGAAGRWFVRVTDTGAVEAVSEGGGLPLTLLSHQATKAAAWLPGDTHVSWIVNTNDPAVDGIYEAAVSFGPYGTPSVSGPATLVLAGRYAGYSWDPTGTQLVVKMLNDPALYVVDLQAPVPSPVVLVAEGGSPQWSPDGSRVAYHAYGPASGGSVRPHQILTVRLADSVVKVLVQIRSTGANTHLKSLGAPRWSPTGDHLLYSQTVPNKKGGGWVTTMYRIGAGGGGKAALALGSPNAWRDP